MMTLTVTAEQMALLHGAITAREREVARVHSILSVLTAGHVPVGATLSSIDTDAAKLTFSDPPDAD